MSTIKSADEHLTLNADGSSKNILFQADGVQKASISSAGLFTSTTIDATVLTGNLPAISGASLTGIADNTPSFGVRLSADQTSIANRVNTKLSFNTEDWDTDSAYDTTNYKFVVPSGGAGKYLFSVTAHIGGLDDADELEIMVWKNGAVTVGGMTRGFSPYSNRNRHQQTSVTVNLAETDYIEAYMYQTSGDAQTCEAANAVFTGFKLAGV